MRGYILIKVFSWDVKEKPEDFVVSEVASYPISDDGRYFLYRLIKRNINTGDLASIYKFRYAGLKDKNALTFQYVSFNRFIGEILFERIDRESFYGFTYIGKTNTKINIGFLKGNKFSVKVKTDIKLKDFFINYFDLQRIEKNWARGLKLILSDKPGKKFSWLEHFLVDSFLSFLWNRGVEHLLKRHFEGYYIVENDYGFYIPYTDFNILFSSFPKFFPILGYKVKLSSLEKEIYEDILGMYNLKIEPLIVRLKDIKIKGDYRKTFLKPEDVSLKDGRINFFIPKGGYATMYLKHIFDG